MNKYTPGPWHWSDAYGEQGLIGPRDGFPVASVTGYYTRNGQSEANARLIAAAPDLLSALIFMSGRFSAQMDENDRTAINSAIAKATGETP